MIVFHEGLPGSGKSYEACLMHIIPQLKKGRRVVTTIEGINHEKFSEHTGIPAAFLRQNLIDVSNDHIEDDDERYEKQKIDILEHSGKDSMIVIDEIQDLFPNGRQKLPTQWSKYFASHRHEGLDIILMGQDFRDMHSLLKRRTQRKIVFVKQTAIGKDTSYKWEAWEATTPEKFQKINSGTRSYEQKYFGLYKSHTDGTSHKQAYKDKRATIFSHGGFKYGPLVLAPLLVWSAFTLYDFFTPKVEAATPEKPEARRVHFQPKQESPKIVESSTKSSSDHQVDEEPEPLDVFDELASQYRPRLSGFVAGHFNGTYKVVANVQILDSSSHKKDVFSLVELVDMGWSYEVRKSGLKLSKDNVEYLVRAWPVDEWGKVNVGTREALGSARRVASAAPQATQRSRKSILIDHTPRPRMVVSD